MKTMKKILLVAIDFWPKIGGVAHYYFNLCAHLDRDHIFVLICVSIWKKIELWRSLKKIKNKFCRQRNLLRFIEKIC